MLKLKPPTHKIDAPATYIARGDPAWNIAKVEADLLAYKAAALAAVQDKAVETYVAANAGREVTEAEVAEVRAGCVLTDEETHKAYAPHPWLRYYAGKTRYQPNAPDWGPDGKPCTVRDYLSGTPAEFVLRRPDYRTYTELTEIPGARAGLVEACRVGLRAIRAEGYSWSAAKPDERATDEQLEALHSADPSLIVEIGRAVLTLCRPLDDTEAFL